MTIVVTYTSIDGFRARKSYQTLKAARFYAQERVGKHPEIAVMYRYAVSGDGIGKITVKGSEQGKLHQVTLEDLFPSDAEASGFKAAQEAKGLVWIGDDHSEDYGCWVPKRLAQWDEYEACWAFNHRLACFERDQHGMPVNYFDFEDDARREAAQRQCDAERAKHWADCQNNDWPF